jgi:hypothetical protein
MGEPYLLDYQENILDEYFALDDVRGISIFSPVPDHVLLVVVDLD